MGVIKEIRYQQRLKKFDPLESVIAVEKDNKWGFKKRDKSKFYLKPQFDSVERLSENVFKVEKEGMFGLVNSLGFQFVPCKYKSIGSFVDGLSAVQKGKYWGFIDDNGIEVIPCIHSEVGKPDHGSIAVKKGYFWGFVYNCGEIALPCEFDSVKVLKDGFKKAEKAGKVFYFDSNFKEHDKRKFNQNDEYIVVKPDKFDIINY